jgi:hypothetical protein
MRRSFQQVLGWGVDKRDKIRERKERKRRG